MPCSILDKHVDYFITTTEMCFVSSRRKVTGKLFSVCLLNKPLFSNPLMNSYQRASEMVVSQRSLDELLSVVITVHVPEIILKAKTRQFSKAH